MNKQYPVVANGMGWAQSHIPPKKEVKCWSCDTVLHNPIWKSREICHSCFADEDGHNDVEGCTEDYYYE